MDTALTQKIPFILDRNLEKANCTGNQVCTSCDTVVLGVKQFRTELSTWFASLMPKSPFKLTFPTRDATPTES